MLVIKKKNIKFFLAKTTPIYKNIYIQVDLQDA